MALLNKRNDLTFRNTTGNFICQQSGFRPVLVLLAEPGAVIHFYLFSQFLVILYIFLGRLISSSDHGIDKKQPPRFPSLAKKNMINCEKCKENIRNMKREYLKHEP